MLLYWLWNIKCSYDPKYAPQYKSKHTNNVKLSILVCFLLFLSPRSWMAPMLDLIICASSVCGVQTCEWCTCGFVVVGLFTFGGIHSKVLGICVGVCCVCWVWTELIKMRYLICTWVCLLGRVVSLRLCCVLAPQ